MSNMISDEYGRLFPQIENADGTAYEKWKGENNAGRITGDISHGAMDAGRPVKIGGRAEDPTALPTDTTPGSRVNAIFDLKGRQLVRVDIAPPLSPEAATVAKQDETINTINSIISALNSLKNTEGIRKIVDPIQIVDPISTQASSENLIILPPEARSVSGISGIYIVDIYREASFFLNVTSASGSGTLDIAIQAQDPASSEWFDIVNFDQVTTATRVKVDIIGGVGSIIRASYNISGTDPIFTFSIGAVVK